MENDDFTKFLDEDDINALIDSTSPPPPITVDEVKDIMDFISTLPSTGDSNSTPINPFILSNQITQQPILVAPQVSIYAYQERKTVVNHFRAVEWFRPRDTNVKTNIQIIDPSFLYLFKHIPYFQGLMELERLTKNETDTYSDLRKCFQPFLQSSSDNSPNQDSWKIATMNFYQETQAHWEVVKVLKEKNKKVFSYQVKDPQTNQSTTIENDYFPFTQKTVETTFQLICKIIANRQNQNTISRAAKKTPPLLNRLKLTIFSPQNPDQVLYIAFSNLLSPRFSNETEKEKGVEFMSKYMELQITDPIAAEQLLQEISASNSKKRNRKDVDSNGSTSSGSSHSTPNSGMQDETDVYFSSLSPQQRFNSGEITSSSVAFEAKADMSNIQKRMKFSSDASLQVADFGSAQNVQIFGDKVTFALPSEVAQQLYKDNQSMVNMTLTLNMGQESVSLAASAPFKVEDYFSSDAKQGDDNHYTVSEHFGDNNPIKINRRAITAGQPSDYNTPPSFEELAQQLSSMPAMQVEKKMESDKKKKQPTPITPYHPIPLGSNSLRKSNSPSSTGPAPPPPPSNAPAASPSVDFFFASPAPPPAATSDFISQQQHVPTTQQNSALDILGDLLATPSTTAEISSSTTSAPMQNVFDDFVLSTASTKSATNSLSMVRPQSRNISDSEQNMEEKPYHYVTAKPTALLKSESKEVRSDSWSDEEKEIEAPVKVLPTISYHEEEKQKKKKSSSLMRKKSISTNTTTKRDSIPTATNASVDIPRSSSISLPKGPASSSSKPSFAQQLVNKISSSLGFIAGVKSSSSSTVRKDRTPITAAELKSTTTQEIQSNKYNGESLKEAFSGNEEKHEMEEEAEEVVEDADEDTFVSTQKEEIMRATQEEGLLISFDSLTISENSTIEAEHNVPSITTVKPTNAFGYNDIQVAIINEDYETLGSLLQQNDTLVAQNLAHKDHFGRTAFHTACLVGDYDAFEMLSKKAFISILSIRDYQNKTCIDLALEEGYDEFVDIINSNMESLFVK